MVETTDVTVSPNTLSHVLTHRAQKSRRSFLDASLPCGAHGSRAVRLCARARARASLCVWEGRAAILAPPRSTAFSSSVDVLITTPLVFWCRRGAQPFRQPAQPCAQGSHGSIVPADGGDRHEHCCNGRCCRHEPLQAPGRHPGIRRELSPSSLCPGTARGCCSADPCHGLSCPPLLSIFVLS